MGCVSPNYLPMEGRPRTELSKGTSMSSRLNMLTKMFLDQLSRNSICTWQKRQAKRNYLNSIIPMCADQVKKLALNLCVIYCFI